MGASRPAGSLRARLSSAASWSGAGSSDGLGTGREYGETTSLPAGASSSRVALKGELEEQIGSWDFSAGKRRRGSSRNDRPLSPGARQDASTRVEQDDIGSEEVRAGIGIDLGVGVKRRRKPKREGSSFYHRSYFEWTDELMVRCLFDTYDCRILYMIARDVYIYVYGEESDVIKIGHYITLDEIAWWCSYGTGVEEKGQFSPPPRSSLQRIEDSAIVRRWYYCMPTIVYSGPESTGGVYL